MCIQDVFVVSKPTTLFGGYGYRQNDTGSLTCAQVGVRVAHMKGGRVRGAGVASGTNKSTEEWTRRARDRYNVSHPFPAPPGDRTHVLRTEIVPTL